MINLKSKKHRLTLYVFIAQILDAITTIVIIWNFGGREMNPLANLPPLWIFLTIKMLIVLLVVWYLLKEKSDMWVYWVATAISFGVIVWNSSQIIKGLILRG